jgi:CRP-like cAMP-binding protein
MSRPTEEDEMARILKDLLEEARRVRDGGDAFEALKLYRLVLEAAPLDFDLRLEIADLFAEMGQPKYSAAIYNGVAEHDIKAGSPLSAMVAIKMLQRAGVNISRLVSSLKERYASESPVLGRSIKLAPADYSKPLREGLDFHYEMADQSAFLLETARMAADTTIIKNYPPLVPPVPIFSTLNGDAFGHLFDRLALRRYRGEEQVITEGDAGEAIYFIARGDVSVVKGLASSASVLLARLGAGSLFGEMALLSDAPRSASVVCDGAVDALELSRDDVQDLAKRSNQVAVAMNRFMSERMILNLFATNPLFKPFGDREKRQLLSRFKGHDVPAGTIFLEEGDMGRGLYVMLQGKAEVTKRKAGKVVKLAEISAGDFVGEMSLVHEVPVSATVRTTTPATLLFLARELFLPLIGAVPELKAYFEDLAIKRAIDTQTRITVEVEAPPGAPVEEADGDADEELSEDDVVFI